MPRTGAGAPDGRRGAASKATKAKTGRAKSRAKRTKRTGTKDPRSRGRKGGDWGPAWLAALEASHGSVVTACRETRVARRTVYDRGEREPAFRAEWDRIVREAHSFDAEEFEERKRALGLTILRQATEGVPRLVVSGGEVVEFRGEPLEERRFSAHLQRFAAEAVLGWGVGGDAASAEEQAQAVLEAARGMLGASITEQEGSE